MAANTRTAVSKPQLNLYQILALFRKKVEILKKDKSGYNFRYTTKEEILSKILGMMDKHEVSLVPYIVPHTFQIKPYPYAKTRVTKAGEIYEEKVNEVLTSGDMEFHWINNKNPEERIIVPWAFVGQQGDASQSFGSGLSYASRYFLLEYFNCIRDDDPDSIRERQKQSEEQEEMAVTAAIIDEIDIHIQKYLEQVPSDKAKLGAFLKRNIKVNGKASTNYFEIKAADQASKLLTLLKKDYELKEET